MSISEDIAALEKALAAGPDPEPIYTHWRDSNKWQENEAYLIACSPDRIRRLLDALSLMTLYRDRASAECKKTEGQRDYVQAKLSKAIDLLKEARAEFFTSNPSLTVAENVDAFLKEVSE